MSDSSNIMHLLHSKEPESIREGARLAGAEQMQMAIPKLVEHLGSKYIGVQEAADRALRKIGGAAVVHAVIPLLRSDDVPQRNMGMDILRELGGSDLQAFENFLHDDDADVRIFVADILGSTANELAVPLLCGALLHDPEVNVRYQAAASLGELAFPSAAKCLNKALGDEEWVQFSVIEALTKLREESSVEALMRALEKSTDLIASAIIDALGGMGSLKVVPLLLKRLPASPTALCNKIVKAIVTILGEDSLPLLGVKDQKSLLGYLEVALKDQDDEIQNAAIKGLTVFGTATASYNIVKLAGTLDANHEGERLAFMESAVAKIGFNDKVAQLIREGEEGEQRVALRAVQLMNDSAIVPLLIEVFADAGRDAQREIINILCDKAGREEQQFFLDVLNSQEDGTILRASLKFLGKHGDSSVVEAPILAMLNHPYNDVKESALWAAITLGTPNVKEYLRLFCFESDPIKRSMGVYALGKFGPDSYLDELLKACADSSDDVRKVTVEALGAKLPISKERMALIKKMLLDKSREVRMAVVEVLGDIPTPEIEELIIETLSDNDLWVQVRCIEKLGLRRSAKVIEVLVYLLRNNSPLIVLNAIKSLGNIGGELAFRSLLDLLDFPDSEVQKAAEAAVDSIRQQLGE